MSQRSSGSTGPGNDDWPDDLWPDDDDAPGGHGGPGASGAHGGAEPALPVPPGWPQRRPPRRRLHPLVTIALEAALAGAVIALGLQVFSSSPTASTSSGGRSSNPVPEQPGGNLQPGGNGQPAPPGGAGGMGSLFMIGRVIAVSSRSITIGGTGHTVTAAITGSTRITGKVSNSSEIKAGDQVSAQITESGGKATVAAIQDPAQAPPGMGAP
jgi:hypothetical protein